MSLFYPISSSNAYMIKGFSQLPEQNFSWESVPARHLLPQPLHSWFNPHSYYLQVRGLDGHFLSLQLWEKRHKNHPPLDHLRRRFGADAFEEQFHAEKPRNLFLGGVSTQQSVWPDDSREQIYWGIPGIILEVPGRDSCFKASFSRDFVFSCMNAVFFVELATDTSGYTKQKRERVISRD